MTRLKVNLEKYTIFPPVFLNKLKCNGFNFFEKTKKRKNEKTKKKKEKARQKLIERFQLSWWC
jgi:hypothetical protein